MVKSSLLLISALLFGGSQALQLHEAPIYNTYPSTTPTYPSTYPSNPTNQYGSNSNDLGSLLVPGLVKPTTPTYPTYPSTPTYPTYPTNPTYPSTPTYPNTQPCYPPAPGSNGQVTCNGVTFNYPGPFSYICKDRNTGAQIKRQSCTDVTSCAQMFKDFATNCPGTIQKTVP